MLTHFSVGFLLVVLPVAAWTADDQQVNVANVKRIIAAFAASDVERIATCIEYPLTRAYPIPKIKTPAEFKARFAEVFAPTIVRQIAASRSDDWTQVGWRGVMFDNGMIWLGNDEQKIAAIHYVSPAEARIRAELIEVARRELHPSLQKFTAPVLEWTTAHYHVRVDACGGEEYRYAAWKRGQKTTDQPEIVLRKGKRDIQGSMGTTSYVFVHGDYRYVCAPPQGGSNEVVGSHLVVYRGDKRLLDEVVIEDLADR